MKNQWFRLLVPNTELQLLGTLNGGQSFRWKSISCEGRESWIGVFVNRLWILHQEADCINYKVYETNELECDEAFYNGLLRDYFQLQTNLQECYNLWSIADKYFAEAAKQFYGIRILKQDVTENTFSFICSSNNNISRISGMVEKLANFYGQEICKFDGESYYAFPKVESLAEKSVEEKLRNNGFGYRAKYIGKAAQMIVENGGDRWLNKLKEMAYVDAKRSLMTLMGVGPKVADCICLMSLGHLQAIPVDTHIYQIAKKFYMPKLDNNKSVTERVYNEIGDHFRSLYGPLAGWAHTVLFCADLKKFQEKHDTCAKPRKKLKK